MLSTPSLNKWTPARPYRRGVPWVAHSLYEHRPPCRKFHWQLVVCSWATAQNLLTVTSWSAALKSCSTEAFIHWLSNAAAGQIRKLCFCSVFRYKVSYIINKFNGCENETTIIFNWTVHRMHNSTSELFFLTIVFLKPHCETFPEKRINKIFRK